MWNIDQIGFNYGVGGDEIVVINKSILKPEMLVTFTRIRINLIEAVSVFSRALPITVIIPSKRKLISWARSQFI